MEKRKTNAKTDNPGNESPQEELTFEDAMQRLERVVRALEQGNLTLDDSLSQYADAMQSLKICYAKLNEAQRSVELLRSVGPDGKPVTQKLADETQSLDEKREKRGQRRSSTQDL